MEDNDSPYVTIGGEDGVRALVDKFYDLMDENPQTAGIRAMHASDLRVSREKLFLFLTGWLGGPPLYVEKYGHPRLRRRHFPFSIGISERDQWMLCMTQALDDQVADDSLRNFLEVSFWRIADHMRNQPEEDE